MKFRLIQKPEEVIDLPRARLQCKIAGADRDGELSDAIAAAREYAEAYIGLPVGEQVREYVYATWCGSAVLPCDITEVVAVSDAAGAVTPNPTPVDRTLMFAATAPVSIRIKCGWTVGTLPSTVKAAMLLLIADYIRNPQAQVEAELFRNGAVDDLLWPTRERFPV